MKEVLIDSDDWSIIRAAELMKLGEVVTLVIRLRDNYLPYPEIGRIGVKRANGQIEWNGK